MALAALVPFAVNVGTSLLQNATSGGGGCPGGLTAYDVETLRARATQLELAPIAAHWDRDNASRSRPAPFYSASAGAIADWLNGGSDCRHTDASSQQLALALLQKYAGRTAAPACAANPAFIPEGGTGQGSSIFGGGVAVTGGYSSDGGWRVNVGAAAGDPEYVQAAAPGRWIMPVVLLVGVVLLLLFFRK